MPHAGFETATLQMAVQRPCPHYYRDGLHLLIPDVTFFIRLSWSLCPFPSILLTSVSYFLVSDSIPILLVTLHYHYRYTQSPFLYIPYDIIAFLARRGISLFHSNPFTVRWNGMRFCLRVVFTNPKTKSSAFYKEGTG